MRWMRIRVYQIAEECNEHGFVGTQMYVVHPSMMHHLVDQKLARGESVHVRRIETDVAEDWTDLYGTRPLAPNVLKRWEE